MPRPRSPRRPTHLDGVAKRQCNLAFPIAYVYNALSATVAVMGQKIVPNELCVVTIHSAILSGAHHASVFFSRSFAMPVSRGFVWYSRAMSRGQYMMSDTWLMGDVMAVPMAIATRPAVWEIGCFVSRTIGVLSKAHCQ